MNQFPNQENVWDVSRAFWRLPWTKAASLEERLAALEQDRTLREVQARFIDALDSGDIEALMSLHHDECVHVGARGTFVGRDAIRQDYERSFTQTKVRVHYSTNVATRLVNEHEAWMTYRNYAVVVRSSGQLRAAATIVAQRLTKVGEEWLIVESRATHLVEHDLDPGSDVMTSPPLDQAEPRRAEATS